MERCRFEWVEDAGWSWWGPIKSHGKGCIATCLQASLQQVASTCSGFASFSDSFPLLWSEHASFPARISMDSWCPPLARPVAAAGTEAIERVPESLIHRIFFRKNSERFWDMTLKVFRRKDSLFPPFFKSPEILAASGGWSLFQMCGAAWASEATRFRDGVWSKMPPFRAGRDWLFAVTPQPQVRLLPES